PGYRTAGGSTPWNRGRPREPRSGAIPCPSRRRHEAARCARVGDGVRGLASPRTRRRPPQLESQGSRPGVPGVDRVGAAGTPSERVSMVPLSKNGRGHSYCRFQLVGRNALEQGSFAYALTGLSCLARFWEAILEKDRSATSISALALKACTRRVF